MDVHGKLNSCDESIGSLEPFAPERSTFNCNAGADLEQLCVNLLFSPKGASNLVFGSRILFLKEPKTIIIVATKLCWCCII